MLTVNSPADASSVGVGEHAGGLLDGHHRAMAFAAFLDLFDADDRRTNAADLTEKAENMEASLGEVDKEELAKVPRRVAASYLEGYQATVTVIKANQAIIEGKRVEIKPDLYELT